MSRLYYLSSLLGLSLPESLCAVPPKFDASRTPTIVISTGLSKRFVDLPL
jgi:hypothetical protein